MGVILNFPNIIETSGIDTSDATATLFDILLNKTAYVNGEKITGIIEGLEATEYNLFTEDQFLIKKLKR